MVCWCVSGWHSESAKDLNTIIFDKTGTLTKGEQGVVHVTVSGIAETAALRIAAGLEGDSEHMIAQAIRSYAHERGITPAPVSHFDSLAGRGVQAALNGVTHFIGGPRLLEHLNLSVPSAWHADQAHAERAGQSVIYLTTESEVVALFAIADVIREESRSAVQQLGLFRLESGHADRR